LNIYPVNGSSTAISFKKKNTDGSAKGMNALCFQYEGSLSGHLKSYDLTGSFQVGTVGGDFTNALLAIAIDADSLPAGFAMSLNVQGQTPYNFDPANDFGYYNHTEYSSGRPSGYYSATSPSSESLTYRFDSGMVTVFELNVPVQYAAAFPTIEYSFTNLPAGGAVFSVYGVKEISDGLGGTFDLIEHTNRAIIDNNSAAGPVSTFEVIPEPTSLCLLALGAATLLRRKKS
jgi:hypothetical protein